MGGSPKASPHLPQGIQKWHTVIGDMRKKVDIPPFEIAPDVGQGLKVTKMGLAFQEQCARDL